LIALGRILPAIRVSGLAAALLAWGPSPLSAQITMRTHKDAGIPVAKLSFLDGTVELGAPSGSWSRVGEGARVKTGDLVRTNAQATVRVEFPFMSVIVGPSSVLGIAPSQVLSTYLEAGRVEEHAEGADAIKLRTQEAQIRGRGHVVVRREGGQTSIMVWEGRFLVAAGGRLLTVIGGVGAVVKNGKPPTAVSLPEPPGDPVPGADPVYLPVGQAVQMKWTGKDLKYHLQLLGIDSDEVLVERETVEQTFTLPIPWPGTYRWHVSGLTSDGLETRPSHDGFVCALAN
jgi:hypothetical protein